METKAVCFYLFGPRSFDQLGIDDFGPAMLALDVRPILEVGGDRLPYLTGTFDDSLELLVLENGRRGKEKTQKSLIKKALLSHFIPSNFDLTKTGEREQKG